MDWSQYWHHWIWLQTLRIREDTVEVPCSSWVCRCLQLQFLPYYYSDLEPVASCCRYVPFHRDLQVSIAGHPSDSDVKFIDIHPVFILHSSTILSVCGTWIIVCFLHFMHICHARHYSTLRNVHYRKKSVRHTEDNIIDQTSNKMDQHGHWTAIILLEDFPRIYKQQLQAHSYFKIGQTGLIICSRNWIHHSKQYGLRFV